MPDPTDTPRRSTTARRTRPTPRPAPAPTSRAASATPAGRPASARPSAGQQRDPAPASGPRPAAQPARIRPITETGATARPAGARTDASGSPSGDGAALPTAAPRPTGGEIAAAVGDALRQSSQAAAERQAGQLADLADAQSTTPAPGDLVADAERAQTPPPGEAESRAQAATVEAVGDAQAPAPDPTAARTTLSTDIAANLPTTLEEVDEFSAGADMTASVRGLVRTQTAGVAQTYGAIEATPAPAQPDAPTVPLPATPSAPPAPRPDLGAGVVGTLPPEVADLSAMTDESDTLLAESGVTDEHLALVTDGPLAEARAERDGVRDTVEAAPTQIDATRQAEQDRVHGELQAEADAGEAEMQAERDAGLGEARQEQDAATAEMERQRATVAAHIQGIYDRANAAVTARLDALEEQVVQRFDDGQRAAVETFEANVTRRMDAWKDERYSGPLGWGQWAVDLFYDITEFPAVKAIIDDEKAAFMSTLDTLLADVTTEIEATIAECQQIVADARVEIETYVEGLGPDLQETGRQSAGEIEARFAELDRTINERRDALQADLAERREDAIAQVEQMVEDMRTGIAAALERLGSLLANAAEAFIRWALTTAGKDPEAFFGALRRAGDVIGGVVADPLGFLGNLIGAVGAGIRQFGTNIKQHLIGGFIEWLTGAMSTVPIQLPETWNLRGILHLVLQLLGLTWDRIRERLVRRVGERPVAIAEASVDIIRRLITDGPIALWEMLVEKAQEIKTQAMEAMQGWAILQLVKAGIIKLVSMLNPAGAIVQGIITIFNVVMFFVENMQRIIAFAQSVVDSVANIAAGRISAAAGFIEQAMARTIPVILGFLGRLIPVSGIGRAVQRAIERVRRPIDRIVDRAIDQMVRLIRRVAGGARRGARRVAQGARDAAGRLLQWWRKEERFQDGGRESHRVYLRRQGQQVSLMMASTPAVLRTRLVALQADPTANQSHITTALGYVTRLERSIDALEASGTRAPRNPAEERRVAQQSASLDALLRQTVAVLRHIRFAGATDFDLPRPRYTFQPNNGRAGVAEAERLSGNRSMGSAPGSANPVGWAALQRGLTLGAPYWRRLHIVNERYGGPGQNSNLVPGTQANNSQYARFDNWVDARIGAAPGNTTHRDVVWMRGVVQYHAASAQPSSFGPAGFSPAPVSTQFARRIHLSAGYMRRQGEQWVRDASRPGWQHTVAIPLPDWSTTGGGLPRVTSIGAAQLQAAARSASASALEVAAFSDYRVRLFRQGGPYRRWSDIDAFLQTQIRTSTTTRAADTRRAFVRMRSALFAMLAGPSPTLRYD